MEKLEVKVLAELMEYENIIFSITSIIIDPETDMAVSASSSIIDGKTYEEKPWSS